MPRCPTTVDWYGLDMTARCVRPERHDGPHRDGVWWFDDHGLRVPQLVERPSPRGISGHPYRCDCALHTRARQYAREHAARKRAVAVSAGTDA